MSDLDSQFDSKFDSPLASDPDPDRDADCDADRDPTSRAFILGCGYVGRPVAKRWQADGVSVTATTTQPDKLPDLAAIADRAVVLEGSDRAGLRAALPGHGVLLASVGAKGRDDYRRAYGETARALAAVVPELPDLKQIIYTSSYAVYGDRGGAWTDETVPPQPANANGEILQETEEILLGLRDEASDRRVCVFRLGGICGPDREVVKIFRRAAGTTRPGSGEDWSNWIHLDDIVGAIAFARDRRLDGVYNLVHDEPLQQKDLLDRAFAKHGLPPVAWDPSQSSPRPYNTRASNQKLKAAGYRFVYREIPL